MCNILQLNNSVREIIERNNKYVVVSSLDLSSVIQNHRKLPYTDNFPSMFHKCDLTLLSSVIKSRRTENINDKVNPYS